MTDIPREVLSGEGEIYAADRLLRRTTYRLAIFEQDATGTCRIDGAIGIATEGEALLLARADELTLLLDDGRHVAFSLANPSGQIRVHGPLEGTKASPR
jgi:hypothetical protein